MQTRLIPLACATLLATACSGLVPRAERITIQQGNLLTPADIEQIEKGMTRSQVRERIGAPILSPGFRPQRWDYVYYSGEAGRDPEAVQRLSLHFDERNRVVEIDDRFQPPSDPLKGQGTKTVPTVDTEKEETTTDDLPGQGGGGF